MLRKTINRRLEFGPEEVKQALICWLKEMDQQYPKGDEVTFTFKLTEDGAELSWQEIQDGSKAIT